MLIYNKDYTLHDDSCPKGNNEAKAYIMSPVWQLSLLSTYIIVI